MMRYPDLVRSKPQHEGELEEGLVRIAFVGAGEGPCGVG